ncbi:uncharacterized protein LAESUDRAFT_761111 [Laetiporus sulphureus 93-53]|uniref:DUF6535 domain-containing protein n=1 Tax=Laetiporus sulphureus 93-53 TaxID=1314785 RepID=A0A165DCE6_9APHY|nr:uncharacterized protein LAESUDRAFT_761111 [Laetiporus sulphureus 93-53]KZT04555.1 hypothetical protein LAESUDRAFT_761111 [Laetiporus sulphureus 93-53]
MSVPTNPPGNTSELVPRQIHPTNTTLFGNLPKDQSEQLASTETENTSERGISCQTWKTFVEQAAKDEGDFIQARNSDLESLLLFATLFSAVLTAFVIESYKKLQTHPGAETVEVLRQILAAIQNNSGAIDTTPSLSASRVFKPTPSALRVNGFWFASLVISVSTAFLAILAKQWLLGVTESLSPDLEMRARQHQHRLGNMEKWKMSVVLAVIPVLLHLSLLLFFAGLIDFLWSINFSIAIVSAGLAGVTVLFYFATHLTSIIWLSSPYRTSLTSLGLALFDMIRIVLYRAISNPLPVIGPIILLLLDNLLRIISHVLRVISKNQEFSERLLDLFRPLYAALDAEPSRKKRQGSVTTKLASLTAPRISEEDYIRGHHASLDANILTALISRPPRWQNYSQTSTLAIDVFRFEHLLEYRTLFLGAGAASFLSRYIRSSTVAGPNEAQAGMLVKQWDILCRLITESRVEEEEDIPLPDDIDWDEIEACYGASRSFGSSGLCVGDAPLIDTDNLHLFSTMLRLQVLISRSNLYEERVGAFIPKFYQRLENLEASHLESNTGALLSVVNTTIFISLKWVWKSANSSDEEDI